MENEKKILPFLENLLPKNLLEGSVLLIDKPYKWSSFQALNFIKQAIKKEFNIKKIKIGHCGTLDPLATGLLVLCTGKFTKKISEIQNLKKTYLSTLTLGATTPSFDKETEINHLYNYKDIKEKNIKKTLTSFIGQSEQHPPIFSAKKVNGKRAYELARANENVILKPSTITIYDLNLKNITLPEVTFEVVCSKGTYIRSLANDIGKKLNSGAFLSELKRTQIGNYHIKDAIKIENLWNNPHSISQK